MQRFCPERKYFGNLYVIPYLAKYNQSLPGCAIVTVFESLIIGAIGSFLANITDPLLVYLRVDDAVGATCVHGFAGAWGILSVGIFARKDVEGSKL